MREGYNGIGLNEIIKKGDINKLDLEGSLIRAFGGKPASELRLPRDQYLIDNFDKIEDKVDICLVVNHNRSLTEILNVKHQFKSQSAITLAEVGNETYDNLWFWQKTKSTARNYLAKAKDIRYVFTPKVSVVVGNHGGYQKTWNQIMMDSDFEDCSFHVYGNPQIGEKYFRLLNEQLIRLKASFDRIHITEFSGINFGNQSNKNTQHYLQPKEELYHKRCMELFEKHEVDTVIYHKLADYSDSKSLYHKYEIQGNEVVDLKPWI